jgi:hypothetical protein
MSGESMGIVEPPLLHLDIYTHTHTHTHTHSVLFEGINLCEESPNSSTSFIELTLFPHMDCLNSCSKTYRNIIYV